MKKLILLILLSPSLSFSQHQYFPANDAIWNGSGITWCGMNCAMLHCYHFFVDTTQVDTLIGGETYSIMRNNGSGQNYFCAYRTDTLENAIYLIPKQDSVEYLFFDFDEVYQVGDSVEFNMYRRPGSGENDFFNYKEPLSSKDSILVDGNYYTTYTFDCVGLECVPVKITEHFLNIEAMPFCMPYFFETETYLRCYMENGSGFSELPNNCPWDEAECNAWYQATIGFEENDIEVSVHPNPASDFLRIELNYEGTTNVQIIDMSGRVIIEKEFKQKAIIDLSSIVNSGQYIYMIQNNMGIKSGSFVKK